MNVGHYFYLNWSGGCDQLGGNFMSVMWSRTCWCGDDDCGQMRSMLVHVSDKSKSMSSLTLVIWWAKITDQAISLSSLLACCYKKAHVSVSTETATVMVCIALNESYLVCPRPWLHPMKIITNQDLGDKNFRCAEKKRSNLQQMRVLISRTHFVHRLYRGQRLLLGKCLCPFTPHRLSEATRPSGSGERCVCAAAAVSSRPHWPSRVIVIPPHTPSLH